MKSNHQKNNNKNVIKIVDTHETPNKMRTYQKLTITDRTTNPHNTHWHDSIYRTEKTLNWSVPTNESIPWDIPSTSNQINFLISVMFVTGDHYITEQIENGYKITMRITIKNVNSTDFGSYRCVAKNSLGETDGTIKLYGMIFFLSHFQWGSPIA